MGDNREGNAARIQSPNQNAHADDTFDPNTHKRRHSSSPDLATETRKGNQHNSRNDTEDRGSSEALKKGAKQVSDQILPASDQPITPDRKEVALSRPEAFPTRRPVKKGQAKPETDVRSLAEKFLEVIAEAIWMVTDDQPISSKTPETMFVYIDKEHVTTQADLCLHLQFADYRGQLWLAILMECKALDHGKTPVEILAQEFSHMLAEATDFREAVKNTSREEKSYTSYLLSWHHTTGYLSKMEVPFTYIDQLHTNSTDLQERVRIQRSKIYKLHEDNDRFKFAMLVTRIMIIKLLRYGRAEDYVKKLVNALV